jgi:hypothetical protein
MMIPDSSNSSKLIESAGRSCLKAWFSGYGENFSRQETPMLQGIIHNKLQGLWVFGIFAKQFFSSEIPF